MPLRRVDTTFDLLEAHIVVGMLRDAGIEAFLFDADFVRQDWFRAIAYGGYRILVPNADVVAAIERIDAYRAAHPTLSDADDLPCPACSSTIYRDDPRPRRWIFVVYWLLQWLSGAFIFKKAASEAEIFAWIMACMISNLALALIAFAYLKRRYLCDACGHRWRDRRYYRYADLSRVHASAFGPPG